MVEHTFGMIKPEGMPYRQDILFRIRCKGLHVEDEQAIILSDEDCDTLYGHIRHKYPKKYTDMKEYLTTNESVILRVSGKDAANKLLDIRGHSNAALAEPGTIRGDYASDQDYTKLKSFAKNVFHASDVDEAPVMIKHFFGE